MAAFLDSAQGWEAGHLALEILDLLCSPAVDLGGQHADLLARLHPVRGLSDVLCTLYAFTEEQMDLKAAGIAFCMFKMLSRHICHRLLLSHDFEHFVEHIVLHSQSVLSVQGRELLL